MYIMYIMYYVYYTYIICILYVQDNTFVGRKICEMTFTLGDFTCWACSILGVYWLRRISIGCVLLQGVSHSITGEFPP